MDFVLFSYGAKLGFFNILVRLLFILDDVLLNGDFS